MALSSPWYASSKVIPSLLAALVGLVAVIYLNLKSDIDELRMDSKEIIKQASNTRLDLVKAIDAVALEAKGTNARLDQLIADGRARQR